MSLRNQAENLIQAIKNGNKVFVAQLLENGCDPNCRVNDVALCTPALIVAVCSEKLACLKLLLKHNANVDACDRRGMTAAMHAADMGLPEYIVTLSEFNADLNKVNNMGANALMMAAKWECPDCVDFLIHRTKDINKQDNDGRTALIYAATQNRVKCLELLIQDSVDLNIRENEKGFTALQFALEQNAIECAHLLLDNNVEINVVGWGVDSQKTALTLAFHNSQNFGDFSMVERLLRLGADMTLSKLDQEYLHEMIARDKRRIVRFMIMNGCPPFDRRCYEYCFKFSEHKVPISPLCVALLSGSYDTAKYFIVNNFFTKYDITILPNDPEVRQKLQKQEDGNTKISDIYNLICSAPQSLKVLCFITIKEALFTRGSDIMTSGLPSPLQLELLFKKWSHICLLSWHELTLEEDQNFETCTCCDECESKGLRIKLS